MFATLLAAALAGVARAQAPAGGAAPPAKKPATTAAKPASKPAAKSSSSERLDGIAAVVNDDVVLQSDVEDQLYQFLEQSHTQPDPATLDTLRRQVLDQLINEKLIVAEAKRQGLSTSDAELNRQVDEALRIQVPASADSIADAKGKTACLEARRRIQNGERFAKVAAELSDDTGSARSGGDLGFFTRGNMEPAVEDAAFSLKLNEVSQPIRTIYGWHLVEVLERDTVKTRVRTAAGRDSLDKAGHPVQRDTLDAKGKAVLEAHARHILIRVPIGDADIERARGVAARVHAEAIKGTDFATLVRRYSRYQGPQDANGDIGFVSLGTLQPAIRAGLDTLEVGQISDVLQNQIGFNIFKLLERRPERPYTYEEIKEELPDAVAEIKMRDRYEEWVKGLRAKAHVEIRDSS